MSKKLGNKKKGKFKGKNGKNKKIKEINNGNIEGKFNGGKKSLGNARENRAKFYFG